MVCPPEVLELVSRFGAYREKYKSGDYNETQLRNEFLNPFFEALGWDIYNKAGYSEGYKDVIHEDRVKIKGVTKAPDYSFRIGTERKFFVEAKKPSVRVKEDPGPALQIRRYGWNAKLPVSILTDFEEFAIYDCTVKPSDKDDSGNSRIFYCQFTDYEEKWDWIAERFSKNGILHGGLDTYTEELGKGKAGKGTVTVDKEFLTSLETWREALAKNIALRNPDLSIRELNDAVTKTIDRLVFLRICEDRGIEREDQLRLISEGKDIYTRLTDLFRYADDKFNSGLFHFSDEKGWDESPDALTLGLKIDDKILKDIISGLYYPKSQFEFSVMPADILGQVYEQFLGKVIRLTEGHQAKVEEKPEVRKAGGVYYTPTYIVDYIVSHTVGELVRDKTPKEVASLRVLDPACGSGSFLIGAYQFLLDWHLLWYLEYLAPLLKNGASPGSKEVCDLLPAGVRQVPVKGKRGKSQDHPLPVYQVSETDWKLTTDEKKRILINNIYGVDIDPQAVEVTKLSLLLKVLEGERAELINTQLKITAERVLPSLHKNIKCGNSLIGSDILSQTTLDGEEIYRVNPFDWDREFSEIMAGGGFDAVIGNPPYVRQESLKEMKEYLSTRYQTYQGTADLYVYFIEKGISLLRENGYFSYIVANKWMRAGYGKPLRRWLKERQIEEIIDFGDLPVFAQATTYPCILRMSRTSQDDRVRVTNIDTLSFSSLDQYVQDYGFVLDQQGLDENGWALVDGMQKALLDKIRASGIPLREYVGGKIYYGIKTGLNKAFVIDEDTRNRLIAEDPKSAEVIKPFLAGRDIKRYQPLTSDKYLLYIPWHFPLQDDITVKGVSKHAEQSFQSEYPAIYNHLLAYKKDLSNRNAEETGIRYEWYALQRYAPEYSFEFENPKIFYPDISNRNSFTLDERGEYYCGNTGYFIVSDSRYLLGILNSNLINYYYSNVAAQIRGGYMRFFSTYISELPIRTINQSYSTDLEYFNKISTHVNKLLALNKQLADSRTTMEKDLITRQIDATDRAIDLLVYELYGFTEEEIRIVEGTGIHQTANNVSVIL